jgi:hypothetical protein
MREDRRLQDLILQLLKDVLPGLHQALTQRTVLGDRDPLAGSDSLHIQPSAGLEQVALQILAELGSETELRDSRDIVAIVSDELAANSKSEFAVALKKAAARLRHPNRLFEFRVPISAYSGLSIQWQLGGIHSLEIRDCSSNGEPPRMELKGCIEAPHAHRLIDRVEQCVKFVIGAFIATGIARFYYARISSVPIVTIEGDSAMLHLDASVGALAAGTFFGIPEDFDEIKARRAKAKSLTNAINPTLERIAYIISSDDPKAVALRSAAILYADAVAAREAGRSVAFALMVLEAVLLERSNTDTVLARLKEAVAYRLGRSREDRARIRKQIGRLYEFRSSFVHTGAVNVAEFEQHEALELVRAVLKREIDDLQPGRDA